MKKRNWTFWDKLSLIRIKYKPIFRKSWTVVKTILTTSNLIAIVALIIALCSYRTTNLQFRANSEYSDSIFTVQFDNAKLTNETLSKMLEKSDSIFEIQLEKTEAQLGIINQQLEVSRQILNDQINVGAPSIKLIDHNIVNEAMLVEGQDYPILRTRIQNAGKRPALVTEHETYTIAMDFKKAWPATPPPKISMIIGPEQILTFDCVLPVHSDLASYFYCFRLIYLDQTMGRRIQIKYYLKLVHTEQEDYLANCNNEEETQLRNFLNKLIETNELSVEKW